MESPLTEHDLFAFLDSLGIQHTTYRHPPVFTVEEAQAARAEMPTGDGHRHSKNLFVRDKKKNHALVIAEESAPINLKELADKIGLGRISFASSDRLIRFLGVRPGSVTPFALLHAHKHPAEDQPDILVVIDEKLLEAELCYFHPLHNEATTALRGDDLLAFMRACGVEPKVMRL